MCLIGIMKGECISWAETTKAALIARPLLNCFKKDY